MHPLHRQLEAGMWFDSAPLSLGPMIMTVRTAAANEELYLPFSSVGTYDVTIDWGDGTPAVKETAHNGPNAHHTYAAAGDYVVTISGLASHIDYYGDSVVRSSAKKLISVDNFGDLGTTRYDNAFHDCSNLVSVNTSGLDTAQVTNMSSMFSKCSKLTSLDVTGFDTAQVTNMSNMFNGCSGLTQLDVAGFDTAQGTNMSNMFNGCSGLTQLDVTGFDTAQVTRHSEHV